MGRGGNLKILNEPFYPIPYYAVGDLYLTTNSENPSKRLGYGNWSLFGPGRTIVCVDTSDSDFNTVKKTGGEKKHTLNVNEMPSHNHIPNIAANAGAGGLSAGYGIDYYSGQRYPVKDANNPTGGEFTGWGVQNSGGSQPHNNLQPFITCYVWLRTA